MNNHVREAEPPGIHPGFEASRIQLVGISLENDKIIG